MTIISQTFSILLPILYLIVIYFYAIIFFDINKIFESKTKLVLGALLAIHATHIILRSLAIDMLPLATKSDALSFLAFAIILVYLVIELSLKNKATGLFALLLSFIIQTTSTILYNWEMTQHPLLINPIYLIHVVLTVLGYSGICISSLYALLYIMLYHNIKYRRLGIIYDKLPSLSILEVMSIRSVQIGILSLGLGIIIGHLRAGDLFGTYFPVDAKVIFSDILWIGYFLGYLVAQLKKWHGRWMAYVSMAGFGILILTNITILFIKETFHHFQ